MSVKEDLLEVLKDPRVEVYLLVLLCAIGKSVSLFNQRLKAQTKPKTEQSKLVSLLLRVIPPILSVAIISITWFYIFRFIIHHQYTSESYFDDAYKDVLRKHYFSSTQLLTWAMVAVVWVAEEEKLASIPYLLFGFLGAMGASFVLWIPSRPSHLERKRRRSFVPIIYAITSILAFLCILKVSPCLGGASVDDSALLLCSPDNVFGSFLKSFRFWLHGLHIILLVPILVSFLPIQQMQLDSTIVYGIMGLVVSCWHLKQMAQTGDLQNSYLTLETDCQKSIHIDLICCSMLTLYAIYHDVLSGTNNSLLAMRNASISALMMPLISPAAVLSFHLCLCRLPASHGELVAKLQRIAARQKSGKVKDGWCNLGLWQTPGDGSENYEKACENLALELAKHADLGSGDTVLSCGCGAMGNELTLFKSHFSLGHITGIDPCVHVDCSSFNDQNVRKIQGSVEEWVKGNFSQMHMFNKILALDNIYHYPDKNAFLRHCISVLPPGGKVAVTDLLWKGSGKRPTLWMKYILSAMGVNVKTLWREDEYKEYLESIGFCDVKIKKIGTLVFSGWNDVFPTWLVQNLEYAIVVANKEAKSESSRPKKKRIAVIGSGMAGLVAAHTLVNSSRSAELEVKVFECNSRPGLSGNTMLIGDQLVDVPARMAALGYYHEYIKLAKSLGIKYQVVKTDCTFHGGNGLGGYVKHTYELSALKNLYNSVFIGGLGNLWKMIKAFSSIPRIAAESLVYLSFGDWLHGHLKLYPPSSTQPGADPSKHQGFQFPYFAQHENPFLYMAIGSFGWMLSCTYRQLVAYPADILLPYIQGLGLTDGIGLFKKATVVRMQPSIRALEHALLYGIPFQGNTKVTNLDKKKIIDGVKYDAVVCATEASAVPYVINDCSEVFSRFNYHPSTIYLHKDPSVLAEKRSDWRTWDVRMEASREEAQLTFWLNRYYSHIKFDGDVFQTWAPLTPPKEELVMKKFELSRVVHTPFSKEMVQAVQSEQGKDGIYYAGSYAVYGMGLLEEAVKSGKIASSKVLDDLFGKEEG